MPRTAPRPALVLVTALLLALGLLAGCGDEEEGGAESTAAAPATSSTATEDQGGETGPAAETDETPPQGPTDAEQIEIAIEAFLVSSDSKEVCEELATRNLLRNAYGDLQGCLDGRGAPTLASAARVSGLEVSGGEATATAVPRGGLYAGSEVDFTVVLEGGSWRVDSVEADIPVGP